MSEDPPAVAEGQGNAGGQAESTQQGSGEDNGGVDVQVPVPDDGSAAAGQSDDSSDDDGGGLARTGFVVAIILGLGLLALSIGIGVRDAARERDRSTTSH